MAGIGGVTQGSFGVVKIGGNQGLVRPSASFGMPRNLDIPHPISGAGYGAVNVTDGMRFPTVNVPAIPLDTGSSNWFSAAQLNSWFITRSSAPVWDLTELSDPGIIFADNGVVGAGQGIWLVNKVK